MAENKTFGVKVPEELHIEATELMKKLNLSGEGFLTELVNVYKSEKAKEEVPVFAEDLKELQALGQRISGIYLNMAYRVENINKVAAQENQDKLTKKESIIFEVQNKYDSLKADYEGLTESFNNICEDKNALTNTVNQLTDNINNMKALIDQYKEKNDTLTGLVNEYKGYKEEREELISKIQSMKEDFADKLSEAKDTEKSLSGQLETANGTIETLNFSLIAAKNEKDSELNKLKESLEFDKKKEVLSLNINHQEQLQALRNDFNAQLEELNKKHATEINSYQEKYKDLLEKLEKKESAPKANKNKKEKPTEEA